VSAVNTIHILPESLANKIAAGEVVERPASVIKELIENSIDAKADQISVHVNSAGMKKIQVVDNGEGMSQKDLELSIMRHATSKIKDAEDLHRIDTLGFRGEALPSIAAVSKMEIISRRKGHLSGLKITVDAGRLLKVEEVGASVGTSVTVDDLFYNTPARKEFLKAASAENAAISEVLTRFALGNPKISFTLVSDHRTVFQSSGQDSRINVIADVYGTQIARKMLSMQDIHSEKLYRVEGYLAPHSITRGTKKHILTFINGRWVKNEVLDKAVMKGYETLLPLHRFPISVIDMRIDPQEIDVNVHPAKLEIRFHHEESIFDFLSSAIRRTLMDHDIVPHVFSKKESNVKPLLIEQSRIIYPKISDIEARIKDKKETYQPPREESENRINSSAIEVSEEPQPSAYCVKGDDENFDILGQFFRTYYLVSKDTDLFIVDQHAAQERVLYELILSNAKVENPSQQLLTPQSIDLTPSEWDILIDHEKTLRSIGFDFEAASGRSLFLRGIPFGISQNHAAEIFCNILDHASSKHQGSHETESRESMIRAACRASVKANDTLTEKEMHVLFQQLLHTQNPNTCPHGRPTMLRFTLSDLEKMFKRT
jgi:DNA mismatch repair protein MutL